MIEATGTELRFTSVSDESLTWLTRGLNVRITMLALGPLADPNSPAAGIIDASSGPGDRLRSRHIHPTDAINLVLEGAMYMDGTWIRPGEAKIVPAYSEYGDQLAGPDGVKFLEIFTTLDGAVPAFVDPQDQEYYQAVHGAELDVHKEAPAIS
jgi:hypothetical protein